MAQAWERRDKVRIYDERKQNNNSGEKWKGVNVLYEKGWRQRKRSEQSW